MNKKILIFLTIVLVYGLNLFAIDKQTINTDWSFALEGQAPFTIDVPHTWNKDDAFSDNGAFRGTAVYSKNIYLNETHNNKCIYLQFDGVNAFADCFVNDQYVGSHKGGYTAFRFDITNVAVQGQNRIKVIVNNELNPNYPPLDGDFTMFGGIYRDVHLIVANPLHFDMDNMASSGVFVTTPNVSKSEATVHVKTNVSTSNTSKELVTIRAELFDANNKKVSGYRNSYKITESKDISFDMPEVTDPHLWSPNSPYLYRLRVDVIDASGDIQDSRNETIGLRWFSVDAKKGFFLNGEHLKLVGVNRHQDFSGYGNALPDGAHLKDMKRIKEMGSNFLRIAHYPQDHTILEECDRLGILACVEVPLNNKNNVFSDIYWENTMERQREMVRQSFNHPSVVIWAMLNECLLRYKGRKPYDPNEAYLKRTGEFADAINTLLKKEDPDRLTMIVNSEKPDIHLAANTCATPDIIGWNLYHNWYGLELFDASLNEFVDKAHAMFPGKAFMITEYGAGADPRITCTTPHRWDYSLEYQVLVQKYFMETILDREDVIGGTVWNYADFASTVRQDTDPNINSKGLMTNDRKAKPAYYYYETLLNDEPTVRIASRNQTHRSAVEDELGSNIVTRTIEVFSNKGEVTLFHNGHNIGTASVDRHNAATFTVPFVDGRNELYAQSTHADDRVVIDYDIVSCNAQELPTMLNISMGDHRYYQSRNTVGDIYLPEQPYTKGSWGYIGGDAVIKNGLPSVGTAMNIYRTEDDPIFQSHREGIEAFRFDVADGSYEITMLWMEPNTAERSAPLVYELQEGKAIEQDIDDAARSFDVVINGQTLLKAFDIGQIYKPRTAVIKKFEVDVRNNEGINIDFNAIQGKTIISGISLRKIR